MAKAGGKIPVNDYHMSMHVGICASGANLELVAIEVGDKEAWRATTPVIDPTLIAIDKQDLFGGAKKEGGLLGLAWWLPGKSDQTLPAPLARKFELTPTTSPGFRGLASIFFTGNAAPVGAMPSVFEGFGGILGIISDLFTSVITLPIPGFKWSSNNPYLKDIAVRVFRPPETPLNPDYAVIPLGNDSYGNAMRSINPAHMVYEVMSNTDWGGMQTDPSAIDASTFEDASITLFNEGLGMNLLWSRESDSYDFLSMVMDHINGRLRPDPATGLYALRLLRDDYSTASLKVISPDNAILTTPLKRRAWGDIVNEVKVNWTNPETGKQETVTAQDPAAIAIQGGIVSASKTYQGFVSQASAMKVAERDLTASVQPLLTGSVSVTRDFWSTVVGDVVKLHWPEDGYNIDEVIMRVLTVSFSGRRVVLGLSEDVFGFDQGSYLNPTQSEWRSGGEIPQAITHYHFGTAPAFFIVPAFELTDAEGLVYPETASFTVASPQTADDVGYRLIGYGVNSSGATVALNLGDKPLQGSWLLTTALAAEKQTTLVPGGDYLGSSMEEGDWLMISDGTDAGSEIMLASSAGTSSWVIERGMLDTVPKVWPIGSRVWVVPGDPILPDQTVRSVGEVVDQHHRTITSVNMLKLGDAPMRSATMTNRPYLPLRPANVVANSIGFGELDLGVATTIAVTWANRNRITESGQAMLWDDASVTGEDGQTTSIYLFKDDATTLITSFTGLTGTSYSFPRTALAGESAVFMKVTAKVGSLESLQGHMIRITAGAVNLALEGDQAGNILLLDGDQSAYRLDLGDY